MRPYLIVSGDFSLHGGMDRANYALATHLADRGVEVHLVAHHVDDELSNRKNVTWHRAVRPLGSHLLGEPMLSWVGRRWARRITRRGGIVVVNGGNCSWGDVNWVHYVHAAYPATGWKHRRYRRIERRALARARLVLANSERTKKDVIEKVGIPAHRVKTVYLGVDGETFAPAKDVERLAVREEMGWSPNSAVVGFVGALGDRRKGFDILFEAWKRLENDATWRGELVVIGAGKELEAWKARAAQAGMTSIHFLGYRKDVARLLGGCDLLVSPTRYEPYGLGVHEALCCGLPVAVSESAGVAERLSLTMKELLIHGTNDAGEVAGVLRRWAGARECYRNEARRLSDELRERGWDQMAHDMVEQMEWSRQTAQDKR